jgi:hypothetical protein
MDDLNTRRQAILDATYQGNKPPREVWIKLITAFLDAGRVNGAMNLAERLERMQ